MDVLHDTIFPTIEALYQNSYVKILLIIIGVVALHYTIEFTISRTKAFIEGRKFTWTKIFLNAIRAPMHYAIAIAGLILIFQVLTPSYRFFALKQFISFETSLIIVAFLWLSISLINQLELHWLEEAGTKHSKFDKTTISASSKILRIIAIIITALILLDKNGISISGIIAFGGVSGVAVGFASKDLLANFLGAFTIYLDKPFKIGDWVKIPDKNIEGNIESIGMRCTVIRTFERRPLYIPNSVFTSVAIENPSRMSHRQINERIGLRYDDFPVIEAIIKDINKMMLEYPDLDQKQPMVATINSLSNAVITILIYGFTKKVDFLDYHMVRQELFLNIYKILSAHGAEIAYIPNGLLLSPMNDPRK